jgi:hypothetical protein
LVVTVNQDTLQPDLKFIRSLYQDSLGRLGSFGEWSLWLPALAKPNGRFMVANAIGRAPEARDFVIKGWYVTYLGRAAQNGEELGWVSLMVAGQTEEQVLSTILSSQEYFNRAATLPGAVGGGPSDQNFVIALYEQILNRAPSQPEIDGWVANLGKLGRKGVALAFLASAEYRATIVRGYYTNLLHRNTDPSPPEVNAWVASGIDFTSIRILFEASPEFYLKVTGILPPS